MDLFSIPLKEEVPRYLCLAEGIGALILQGKLKPNEKLPPIRTLAKTYGVTNGTIVSAYRHLEQRKLVYSHVGSGTFVSPLPVEQQQMPLETISFGTEEMAYPADAIRLDDTALPADLFPVEAFQEAFRQVLEKERGAAFRYTESMGYFPLRQSLCTYLSAFGIQTSPKQVQIISGAQQGVDIAAKAMISLGDVVFLETPTFYGAAGAFLSRGARLVEIPLEKDGMDLNMLENMLKLYHPKLLYMMGYFQTPTGISYSLEKKRRLLELAETYDFIILEEDDFYDFHYGKDPIVPLKAFDFRNRVIYIKSFSKVLMPGLRMGLMVVPPKLQEPLRQAKITTDIATSGFLQRAMALFLQEHGWEEHASNIRSYGGRQYRLAVKLAKKYLSPFCNIPLPQGGVCLWLPLPEEISSKAFTARMLEKKVILTDGDRFFCDGRASGHVRLSFAAVDGDKLEVGIKRMADVLELMLGGEK